MHVCPFHSLGRLCRTVQLRYYIDNRSPNDLLK